MAGRVNGKMNGRVSGKGRGVGKIVVASGINAGPKRPRRASCAAFELGSGGTERSSLSPVSPTPPSRVALFQFNRATRFKVGHDEARFEEGPNIMGAAAAKLYIAWRAMICI